jgi:superfamily II RNA helicase
VPEGGTREPGEILGRFLDWVSERGIVPYPEQEEAILALAEGRHVILATPTGSGKSLVATALHFKALCEGLRSFYTAPTKALVSEKFFSACEDFGPESVAMLTGDASINPAAPIVCCTAEVLSNMALRQGAALDAPYVCMDEFHYYADRDRGVAWQVPLLALPRTRFLLMSATLGNTAPIAERIEARSGIAVDEIYSDLRPVPLEYDYRETPIHETLEDLVARARAPVYVVNFTHRECAEQAQALTSARVAMREERERIVEAIGSFRFDTPFGKDLSRWLRFGIGVHHAGMLPRYRLLVERLAQRGLLRVICGTDTLGVGVNIPIRSVLFEKLCKFDGEKVAILPVREFKQIAGRAGRRGFDERGFVVAQAPPHVIEKRKAQAREAGGKRKAAPRPPPKGMVAWGRDTFERLVERPPETLESRFAVGHGMLVNVLQRREPEAGRGQGYRDLLALVARSHESEVSRRRLRRRAAALFRSLRRSGIVELARDPRSGRLGALVREELQLDFGLHQTLSLYVVEAVAALDPEAPSYPLEVLSIVEAVLESPRQILAEQVRKLRGELVARLKAEGVPYEDRMRELEVVVHPKPEAEFLAATFRVFAEAHPWVGAEDLRPKSIAREIFERYLGFVDYVREYSLARSEGVLLRYLSQVQHTLVQTVPEEAKTDELHDVIAYLRTLVNEIDSSLVSAWEELLAPASGATAGPGAKPPFDLALQPRALAARVRAELHTLVRALARGELEEAPRLVAQAVDDPWDAERFRAALAPFLEEYGELLFTPEARQARHTRLRSALPRVFDVTQVLVDPEGDLLWAIHGRVDLRGELDPVGPVVQILRIGS